MQLSLDEKIAGVLVPVFALRGAGDLGIGDAWSVMEFIDWAATHGFRLVKFLPINETGGDHSPYNAISTRALDPTTIRISPEAVPDLRAEEYDAAVAAVNPAALDGTTVDYSLVKPLKRQLLEKAFARFQRNHFSRKSTRARDFLAFVEEQRAWLPDYTLFRALLEENGGIETWTMWAGAHCSPAAARSWVEALPARKAKTFAQRTNFFAYVQWLAFTQWRAVRAHATKRGVALMGDIPFGVSTNSAEVWAQPELFRTGWYGGTPPDRVFKHDEFVQKWGQNWGIPLYDWPAMRRDDFRWWRDRVRGVREFFDLFRIDHVLGFYRIYGFPWRPQENEKFLPLDLEQARAQTDGRLPGFQPRPDDTEENCGQNRLDGEAYLRAVVEEAGAGSVVGEDLGEVPDYVRPSLATLGIAGYKIPQWEKHSDGRLIPGAEYQRLSLATYGTHDHEPLRAYWQQLANAPHDSPAKHEWWALRDFAGIQGEPAEFTSEVHAALLRALFHSNAWLAVAMITDVFGRGERFNCPGVSSSENWTQRTHLPTAAFDQEPAANAVAELIKESGRSL